MNAKREMSRENLGSSRENRKTRGKFVPELVDGRCISVTQRWFAIAVLSALTLTFFFFRCVHSAHGNTHKRNNCAAESCALTLCSVQWIIKCQYQSVSSLMTTATKQATTIFKKLNKNEREKK